MAGLSNLVAGGHMLQGPHQCRPWDPWVLPHYTEYTSTSLLYQACGCHPSTHCTRYMGTCAPATPSTPWLQTPPLHPPYWHPMPWVSQAPWSVSSCLTPRMEQEAEARARGSPEPLTAAATAGVMGGTAAR